MIGDVPIVHVMVYICLEDAPYQLVKGQQMNELIRETAEPTISLVTDMKEGQCCQLQVSGYYYYHRYVYYVCVCLHTEVSIHNSVYNYLHTSICIRWRV